MLRPSKCIYKKDFRMLEDKKCINCNSSNNLFGDRDLILCQSCFNEMFKYDDKFILEYEEDD